MTGPARDGPRIFSVREVLAGRYAMCVIIPAGSTEALRADGHEKVEILVDPRISSTLAAAVQHTIQLTVLLVLTEDLGRATTQLQLELGRLQVLLDLSRLGSFGG